MTRQSPPSNSRYNSEGIDDNAGPDRVLVLGDDTRSFLSIVRSLGRQGIEVHVVPYNYRSPALRSRYIQQIHTVPQYLGRGTDWITSVLKLIKAHNFNLVIPADDRAILAFQEHKTRLPESLRIAMPDDRSISVLFDKCQTRQLAASQGVPIARGRPLSDNDDASSLIAEFGLPLLIKPKRSYTLNNLHVRGKVKTARDADEVEGVLVGTNNVNDFFVERFFSGTGVGLSVLANNGEILLKFQHRRLREPSGGGGSSYREPSLVNPEMLDACRKMLAELSYSGVAMFEFRVDDDTGRWILLEVNARFWGSLPLAIRAGVDFPFALYRLIVKGESPVDQAYRQGVYSRNLALDLNGLIAELGRRRIGLKARASVLFKFVVSYLKLLSPDESLDTFSADDTRPGIAEALQVTLGRIGERIGDLWSSTAASRYMEARDFAREAGAREGIPKIVFVCMGNICRSPYAEHRLRFCLQNKGLRVEVSSLGLFPVEDRLCPEFAIRAARSHGIDLTSHKSKSSSSLRFDSDTILIIFDKRNEKALYDLRPDIDNSIFYLQGLLKTENGNHEIPDPYGQDYDTFLRTYENINLGIDEIVQLIVEH